MNENKLITPRKLQGFWELLPDEQICFSSLLKILEDVFSQNCFLPLDTPILEYSEALLAKSGGETDKQVFRFTKGDSDVCMRYDLTVPLARFVAMHRHELAFPFKRYQIGKVFRGERPQKGRYRELYQCDADIIGLDSLSTYADAECIRLFEKCFDALDLDVEIRVSNRKLLSGFFKEIGSENLSNEILTILDKSEKIGEQNTLSMLKDLGLDEKKCEKLAKLVKIKGNFSEISSKLVNFCKNDIFLQGLNELQEIDVFLKNLNSKKVIFDLSIIRGHDYYTGTVFEAFLKDEANLAVGGGGRFENLCSYFSTEKMPGVGMSIGITRIFDILKQKFEKKQQKNIEIALINFEDTFLQAISLCEKFRLNNIRAEIFSENKSFKSKMKEADKRKIKFCLIVGEDELKSGKYTLKNMENGEQTQLEFEKIVEKLKSDRM